LSVSTAVATSSVVDDDPAGADNPVPTDLSAPTSLVFTGSGPEQPPKHVTTSATPANRPEIVITAPT
jgi:hypothetical protein